MELILVGINILLIMAVWRFMLRKTILDHYRDQLFDLRDELRAAYIKNGLDLGSPVYKKLRSLINGYLRFTEDYSLSKLVYILANVPKNKDFQEKLKTQMARDFHSPNKCEQKVVEEFRVQARGIMTSYMVYGSGLLLTAILIASPLTILLATFRLLTDGISRIFGKMNEFHLMYKAFFRYVATTLLQKILKEEFVEGYAYRKGSVNHFVLV